jgi:hypothetical protein
MFIPLWFVFFPPCFFLYLFALELYRSVAWSPPLGRASISARKLLYFFRDLDFHRNQNEPTATRPYTGSPLSPWQHLPWTQLLVPPVPIYQGQAHCIRFAFSAISSLVWGAEKRPIKNREMGRALALGGRCSIMKNNNQLVVGVRGGMDVGEEARWG